MREERYCGELGSPVESGDSLNSGKPIIEGSIIPGCQFITPNAPPTLFPIIGGEAIQAGNQVGAGNAGSGGAAVEGGSASNSGETGTNGSAINGGNGANEDAASDNSTDTGESPTLLDTILKSTNDSDSFIEMAANDVFHKPNIYHQL